MKSETKPVRAQTLFHAGDDVFIVGDNPWAPNVGTLIVYEKYGLGWWGWRVQLQNMAGQECYANENDLRKVK
jgi:hypothetical protein